MNLLKIYCRGEPIIITKEDIEIEEDWFLPLLLKYEINNEKENGITEVHIGEERNLILSVIETIRYNKLIKFDNIPLDLMHALCEKWCCPEHILNLILEEKENSKLEKEKSLPIVDINDYFLECSICEVGFKIRENTAESCKTHSKAYSSITSNHPCCGNNPSEGLNFCRIGYHVPTSKSIANYNLYKKHLN